MARQRITEQMFGCKRSGGIETPRPIVIRAPADLPEARGRIYANAHRHCSAVPGHALGA